MHGYRSSTSQAVPYEAYIGSHSTVPVSAPDRRIRRVDELLEQLAASLDNGSRDSVLYSAAAGSLLGQRQQRFSTVFSF